MTQPDEELSFENYVESLLRNTANERVHQQYVEYLERQGRPIPEGEPDPLQSTAQTMRDILAVMTEEERQNPSLALDTERSLRLADAARVRSHEVVFCITCYLRFKAQLENILNMSADERRDFMRRQQEE